MRGELVVAPGGVVSRALGERHEARGRVAAAEDVRPQPAVAIPERERLAKAAARLRIAPAVEPGDFGRIAHALALGRERRYLPAVRRGCRAPGRPAQVEQRL